MTESERTKRVLCVVAHPDDVDFGAAGTIAGWVAQGMDVRYCIVTDGDAGGFDPAVPRDQIGGIRRREQRAAAAAIGVTSVDFLGYPDGYVEVTMGLRKDLAREIRRHRPGLVLTQSPQRNPASIFASHPDHLAVGEATICSVYPDAQNPYWMPDLLEAGFEPHSVSQIWIMGTDQPDTFVDISDTFEQKLAALKHHESQMPDVAAMEERVRAWTATTAEAAGMPEGSRAEAFLVIELPRHPPDP